ncbi:MAG: hypothetical protein H7174_01525, partial [Flavobacterium sp.]|nr:hypothetical protein [Flavobacterium sp.]
MKKFNLIISISIFVLTTLNTKAQVVSTGSGGSLQPNATVSNQNVGIGTTSPTAALHLFTGSNAGMLPPKFVLERNDGTNQAGFLTIGISSNGFATGLGGGSAIFKLEDPYGNSANSDMGFATNGLAAQLVIKHNGFVGIGTSTPTANFHSIGRARLESLPTSSSNTDVITSDALGNLSSQPASTLFGTGSGWSLAGNATAAGDFIGTTNANPFNVYTNNTQRMTIDATGKMGLGTTTPTGAALHLLTGTNAGMLPPVIKLDRNDGTNQAGLLSVGISGNGFASGLLGGGSAYFKLEDPYGNSANSDMGFSTNGLASQMVIKHSGNVGIATETPTARLHSVGTARLESLPSSSTNTDIITTDALGNLSSQPASTLFGTGSGWLLSGNATAAGDFIGTTNTNPFNIYTNNTQRMTIDATGKMGLGTTTPTGAALHLLTGTNAGMLPPVIKLDRNDATNQAGLLSVGISGNGFASGLLAGGSAYFKLEDPYGNSANSDMGFSTNGLASQMVIKHSGNVGIATETPTARFHSVGTARLESLPTSSTNTDIITSDALGNLSSQPASTLFGTGSGWSLAGNATAAGDFIGTTNINPFNIYTN